MAYVVVSYYFSGPLFDGESKKHSKVGHLFVFFQLLLSTILFTQSVIADKESQAYNTQATVLHWIRF